jgi:hypothetical protein
VGLGLALVKSITHAHDGTLTITPRAAGGLGVTVHLPGVPEHARRTQRRPAMIRPRDAVVSRFMPNPENPVNIPVRENLPGADGVVPAAPGDANPDLERPSTPGPLPAPDADADEDGS